MYWQWGYIVFALLASVRAFECPEGAGCSSCQRNIENAYELSCLTSSGVVEAEIRPNSYVKLSCYNSANWTEFHLGSSHPVHGVKTLLFDTCNLPGANEIGSIAKELITDNIEILIFHSDLSFVSTLTRETLRGLSHTIELTLTEINSSHVPDNLFQDLPNLKKLNLQNNNLHYLPKDLFRTPNLEAIELSTNKLETLDSSSFGKLRKLRLLSIWNNKLVKILPNTFDELVSLETLNLKRNKLETLPNDVFVRLGTLSILNLSQNNFTPGSLGADLLRNCSNLRSFILMENRRNMTTVPERFFANLTKLTLVKLRRMGLTSLPEDLFSGTISLKNVSIEMNYLSTLPSKIFTDTHDLMTLDLSFNDLSSLPDDVFTNLSKLVKLDLSKNHLTTISEKLFYGLISLCELNMERNKIISIHFDALQSLRKLRVARFSYNSLTLRSSEETRESPFYSSEELEELYLDHNNISDIYVDWMYSMTSIRVLNLAHNRLQLLKHEDLEFLSQDLNVDLTYNNIRHIDLDGVETWAADRSHPRNIIVSIENNPVECDCKLYNLLRYLEGRLHPNVHNAFELKIGQMKCNAPNVFRNVAIADLKSKSLKCDANMPEIESYCPKQCRCSVRPENKAFLINCDNGHLTEAPRKIECPRDHSVELNLSSNSLMAMPNFDQPGYDKVTVLALDHNNISRVSIDTLSPNLKVLKLNNNRLSRLDQAVIDFLDNSAQLTKLTLESNPWLCDCEARELLNFIQKNSVTMPDLLKVTCPGQELPVFKMTPEELCPSDVDWIIGGCLVVAFFGIIVGCLAAMYYRYQREIKVWLYAKNWCLWFVTENELDKDKLFDAFISYSHKDEDFVLNDLIPKLEADPRPFKLCVHFRDWLVGEWIPKQIARSVEESRRTIVVLSANFLESVWGRMEFRAAHSQALSEGRARVIVIIYGEIGPTDDLDPELKAYLSINTYVKWGDPWFWEKLQYAMPHSPEFVKHKFRRNMCGTIQPHINMINSKSEFINPTGISTNSVEVFIDNGVTHNESEKPQP